MSETARMGRGYWIERAGERRCRSYKVTAEGRRVLAEQPETWAVFVIVALRAD